jgi:pyruvate/2-oxoglutarate dehydrogenase complex dihydrolipoamide dehydrogenase (E3) component
MSSMTAESADVVLLGVGTCGEDLGLRLAGAGLDVVGIEDGLLGGECAYWACIPTKMMIRAADLLQEARRVDGVAGQADVTPDWGPVAKRIREEASGDWNDTVAVTRFEEKGGRFVRGRGKLTDPSTVTVGDQSITATRGIVIATGSKPVIPPIPGLAEIDFWTTHEAIKAEELPASLIILGGGAAGCEIGQVYSRFGAEVTVVEGRERLLPSEELEASEVVSQAFEAEGISVQAGAPVEGVETRGESVVVSLSGGTELAADRLLVAAGRIADIDGLGLDAAGVDGSAGCIQVDDHLRAGNGIWAMGDVTGHGNFTHVALYQASIVAAQLLGDSPPPADYHAVPRVTFTDPEVGAVGMGESDARAAGLDVVTTVKSVPATFKGWLHGPGNEGVIKLVADREAGVLVGATSVGPRGSEVLGLLSAAVHARVPITELQWMIYAFPTFHGGVGEAFGAYARGLQQVLDPTADQSLVL